MNWHAYLEFNDKIIKFNTDIAFNMMNISNYIYIYLYIVYLQNNLFIYCIFGYNPYPIYIVYSRIYRSMDKINYMYMEKAIKQT